MHRPFRTPMVPAVPILGVVFCTYLMARLPMLTWLRFFTWLAVGLIIYFSYGRFHSRVEHAAELAAAAK
jgi:APA family basic amino acid/polyamine antiporter